MILDGISVAFLENVILSLQLKTPQIISTQQRKQTDNYWSECELRLLRDIRRMVK